MTILDISKWQGAISQASFTAAKNAGVKRLIHKAGGSNAGRYTDSQYLGNVPRARAAGLRIGHYWFNGLGDPATDAAYFLRNLSGYTDDDWLVIDVESEGAMSSWSPDQVLAWVKVVRAAKPKATIVVYMSSSVTRARDWSRVVAAGVKLWVAQYSSSKPSVAYWPGWISWQFTSSGTIPGYGGRVDLSTDEGTSAPVPPSAPVGRNTTSIPTAKVQAAVGAKADGVYGADTTAKVAAWQAAHGLAADGVFGPATAARMFPPVAPAKPPVTPSKPAAAKLKVDGKWGPDTTGALQRALKVGADNKLGPQTYSALQKHIGCPVDGQYGPVTKRRLQQWLNVTADGNVGLLTVKALQTRLNAGTF